MDTNSFKEREEKRQTSFRTIYDMVAGLLWLGAGIFIILNKYFGFNLMADSLMSSLFGIACIFYGSFRLYRGVTSFRGNRR